MNYQIKMRIADIGTILQICSIPLALGIVIGIVIGVSLHVR